MAPMDISAIESEARRMRAEELRRINGLISKQLALYGSLFADAGLAALATTAAALRPLFSWNPQAPAARTTAHPALATRLSRMLRALFSWNPQAPRPR